MKLISFECPDDIVDIIEKGKEQGKWVSISDAIRDILRNGLKEMKISIEPQK